MRKKVKQLFNQENGFTLIELLAVIVILGVIVAIAIPAIGSVIDQTGTEADDAEIAMVEDATRLYITTEYIELEPYWKPLTPSVGDKRLIIIPIGKGGAYLLPEKWDLYSKGYLEDRANEEPLKGDITVVREPIAGQSGGYTYDYKVKLK